VSYDFSIRNGNEGYRQSSGAAQRVDDRCFGLAAVFDRLERGFRDLPNDFDVFGAFLSDFHGLSFFPPHKGYSSRLPNSCSMTSWPKCFQAG
jgi:hypothetical protein